MELIKFDKALLNKQGATSLSEQLLNGLESGNVNPLELQLVFKTIEKAKEAIEPTLKKLSLEEAGKYEGKNFSFLGNAIEVSDSLGVRYDYSNCNHQEYDELVEKVKKITARIKEIEKELQAMTKYREEFNSETGEVYRVYPPIKSASTGVKITLK